MKVAELIAHLKQFHPDTNVYTAKDEEGNGFNDPWEICLENFDEEDYAVWAQEDVDNPEEGTDHLVKAVVIW